MSIITHPASRYPASCLFTLETNQRVYGSPAGGSEQVVDQLNDRWRVLLTYTARNRASAGSLDAFLASMRGQTNTVGLWHFARPQPLGTMRGTPVLSAPALQGASSISIFTSAGGTVLAGDMLGVAGLLLQAQSDATANGSNVMTLPIVNRLRTALAGSAPVVWDQPLVQCTLISNSGQQYTPGVADAVSCEFIERIY